MAVQLANQHAAVCMCKRITHDWITRAGSSQDSLSAVQRRRTAEDELNMRAVYTEGDLISVSFQLHSRRCMLLPFEAAFQFAHLGGEKTV